MRVSLIRSTFALTSILLVAALALALTSRPASGAHTGTVFVDVNGACGDDASHGDTALNPVCSLQFAIMHAGAGDTIAVASGTYDEVGQIVIGKDLTIAGQPGPKPVIRPTGDTASGGDGRGFFLVIPGVEFAISNVEINGNGFKVWQAIRSRGRLIVTDVDFVDLKFNASGPHYSGSGIAAFGEDAGQDLVLSGSTFTQIGRAGVLVFGSGTDAITSDNVYTGKGDGDFLDYAFEVGGGGTASIVGNTVTDNRGVASSDGSTSAGILATTFFASGTAATIEGNTLSANSTGIAVGFGEVDTSSVAARFNNIAGNTDFGVTSAGGPLVDAQCNWWGDASGPTHPSKLGGTGDPVTDDVAFAPHAAAPFPGNACSGFVAGGGSIESPEGASTAFPGATGTATFSFVARHKRGHNVPDGQTQFQFNAADLSFHSDSYDWLIVAGAARAQFKGIGRVNGVPGYDFILTVYDGEQNGDPDGFRIKITGPGGVLYDNKPGADNGITQGNTQELAAGSIVIHTR